PSPSPSAPETMLHQAQRPTGISAYHPAPRSGPGARRSAQLGAPLRGPGQHRFEALHDVLHGAVALDPALHGMGRRPALVGRHDEPRDVAAAVAGGVEALAVDVRIELEEANPGERGIEPALLDRVMKRLTRLAPRRA